MGYSFICNVCCNFDKSNEYCKKCNGSGVNFDPKNKEKYKANPKEYIKNLILSCR